MERQAFDVLGHVVEKNRMHRFLSYIHVLVRDLYIFLRDLSLEIFRLLRALGVSEPAGVTHDFEYSKLAMELRTTFF
jgi:hypothetical protein